MAADLRSILRLEVPVIVVLGSRSMKLSDVVALAAGAIVELPKNADDELELCVNNKVVGVGKAVKVGENFGIRITFLGDVKQRIAALGQGTQGGAAAGDVADTSRVGGEAAGGELVGAVAAGSPGETLAANAG